MRFPLFGRVLFGGVFADQSALARVAAVALAASTVLAGCGPSSAPQVANRTPLADKWLARAKQSFRSGDFDDARDSAQAALQASKSDPDVRLLNARIALSRLDFAEALKLTEGLDSTEVHGVRGRAHWYAGSIEDAADELEAMLRDPTVKDPWAREVARLARRGNGRHPFAMEGALLAPVEMPKAGPAFVVPCELEGENILALVATSRSEVVLDASSRKEPAWVNLRFGEHLEVRDVPAVTEDLSGLSRQFGAPIKALLGVNLLRHLHVTFDRRGDQFIVRAADPQAPPGASRVPLWYVRGGGMLLSAKVGAKDDSRSLFLVDTAAFLPMALDDAGWRKAGVDPSKLQIDPSLPANGKSGIVPSVKLAGFDLPSVPAAQGLPADVRAAVDVDVEGIIGAGLLSLFRITLADEGRFAWLEGDGVLEGGAAQEPSQTPVRKGAPAAPRLTPPGPARAPAVPLPAPPEATQSKKPPTHDKSSGAPR